MKKIIRSIVNKFGYDFVKTDLFTERNKYKKILVKVGNFDILMPGNNPQIINYKNVPDLNSQLGHLAKCVESKYNDLNIIDIGANVGDTIAIIKTRVNTPIIAIEGDNTSFQFLEINSKQFSNLYLIKTFLGEAKKTIGVEIEKGGWNNTIIPTKNAKNLIDFDTLDNILIEHNMIGKNLKLLKIDTEGFDTIILRGCINLLKVNKPVLFFEYNGQNMKAIEENGIDTIINLKNYNYDKIGIFDGLGNLVLYTTLDDVKTIKQLNNYLFKDNSFFPFFDICIFHEEDNDLADNFITIFN